MAAPASLGRRAGRSCPHTGARKTRAEWQPQREPASLPGLTLDREITVHCSRHLPTDGEAKPRPGNRRVSTQPYERLEDHVELVARDTGSRVGHPHEGGILVDARSQPNDAANVGELHGIAEQVQDDLPDALRV